MRRLIWFSLFLVTCVLISSAPALAEKRGVRVDGKSAADYVAEQIGKSWAVVIGIDEYRDPKIRRLKYAVADATAVGKELERRGYQVTLLLNGQATERGIKTELRSKLRARAHKDDRVVIYYAGHGQDDKVEGTKTMGYLLPVDGELDDIPGTGISMGLIKELADGLAAKQVLFLMDACYGGVAGQQTRSLLKMTEAYLKQITREKGRQLITAGGADQEALEASDGGHGLFTYYLLRGLSEGHADLNDDGIIPASELYAYLDSKVFTDAQMKGHTQRPELWTMSPEKGEFVFFASARGGGLAPAAPVPVPGPASDALSEERQRLQAERDALQAERTKMEADKLAAEKAALAAERARLEVERQAAEAERARADVERTKLEVERQAAEKAAQERAALEAERKKIEVAKAYDLPKQASREIEGKDGAKMLLIPAGSFDMGNSEEELRHAISLCRESPQKTEEECRKRFADELPRHRVSLDAFYLDKYEVTNRRFQQFVQSTGYQTTADKEGSARDWVLKEGKLQWGDVPGANWRKPEGGETVFVSNRDEHPVVSVSWYDAEAYCRWTGKRLPTEAEFEYALRAGTTTSNWWGNGNPGSRRVANIADEANKRRYPERSSPIMVGYDDGYARTAPVGSYEANPWGLHDIIGNVSEWTADWYDKDYYEKSQSRNPTGPPSGERRVLRGGSWLTDPFGVRSARRLYWGLPTTRNATIGFRCAQDAS